MSVLEVGDGVYQYSEHAANDASAHSGACGGWEQTFAEIKPGPFTGLTRQLWLGPVQLIQERTHQPFNYRGCSWKDSRVFISYLPTHANIHYNSRPVSTNVVAIHGWDSMDRAIASGPTESVTIAVHDAFLQDYMARISDVFSVSTCASALIATADPAKVSEFQSTVASILNAAQAQMGGTPQFAATELQDRVMRLIYSVFISKRGAARPLPRPSTRAFVVQKAVGFMEDRLAEAIPIVDVCEALRVSPRTLRYSFESVMGVSPSGYLLSRRLSRIRQELSKAQSNSQIQILALKYGFWHMGRFAQYYRRAFGERPSDTVRHKSTTRAF